MSTFDQKIEELRARQEGLVEENQSILATAQTEKRELNTDELKTIKSNTSQFDDLTEEIKLRELTIAQTEQLDGSVGRKTEPAPVQAQADDDDDDRAHSPQSGRPMAQVRDRDRRVQPRIEVRAPGSSDKTRFGFSSLGQFALAVAQADSTKGARFDPRLDNCIRAAATTYSQESIGEQGGYLVPPGFSTTIMEKVMAEDSLVGRTDVMQTSSNSFTFPKDETTPWQTSGGVLAYWDTEGSVINQTRVSLGQETVRLNRLTALCPVTEELLEDAAGIDGFLSRKIPEKMSHKVDLAIVQGTGAGQPLGILYSPALVSVAKESGQTADTVVFENFRKMWGRLYARCRGGAIWLVDQDVETALMGLQFPGTGTAVPVFMPPGGLRDAPFATLLGRPVVPTECCNKIGDQGDVFLVDLRQYLMVRKTVGPRIDTSIHFYFDSAQTAFRAIWRIGGQPWWGSAITRRGGGGTLSCIVTLDAR